MPGSKVKASSLSSEQDCTDRTTSQSPEGAAASFSRPKVNLPKPVGDSMSGPTRLSELKSREKQPNQPVASGSASKFFQPSTTRSTRVPKAESVLVDLVFEDESPVDRDSQSAAGSDGRPSAEGSHSAGPADISVPPSPVCSTIFSSPVKPGSECDGSPVSSPESFGGHSDEKRSVDGFTSPFDRNQDDFARARVRLPTPSPSPAAEAKDKAVIAPQTPITPTPPYDNEEHRTDGEIKQESRTEIDLSHFYARDNLVASPISLLSDVESEVEETQQETAEQARVREEQQQQEVKAVAAGWKAKYTFGGMASGEIWVQTVRFELI